MGKTSTGQAQGMRRSWDDRARPGGVMAVIVAEGRTVAGSRGEDTPFAWVWATEPLAT